LLRRHTISSRLFAGWFLVGAGLAIVFGVPTFFSVLQGFLGTQFLLSSVVFAGAIAVLSLIFYQQWKLSDSENKIRSLAGEVALLKYRIDEPLATSVEDQRSK
jgi:hypothetical protein